MRTRSQVLFNPRRSVSPRPSAGSGSTASEDHMKPHPRPQERTPRKPMPRWAPQGSEMGVQRPTEMRISGSVPGSRLPAHPILDLQSDDALKFAGVVGHHGGILGLSLRASVAWRTKCGPGRDFSGVASGPTRQHSRERDSAKPELPNLDRLFHHALNLADGAVEA